MNWGSRQPATLHTDVLRRCLGAPMAAAGGARDGTHGAERKEAAAARTVRSLLGILVETRDGGWTALRIVARGRAGTASGLDGGGDSRRLKLGFAAALEGLQDVGTFLVAGAR